jgi:hypothetical protein
MADHHDPRSWFEGLRARLHADGVHRLGESVSRGMAETLLPGEGEPWVAGEVSEEALVEFDFSDWPTFVRLTLENELQARNMEHLWRGAHLLVPLRMEDSVDDVLDELADAAAQPTPDDSDLRWCPSCGGEFIATVTTCPDCGVALSDEPLTLPLVDVVPVVSIDLSGWSPETRLAFAHQIAGGWPLFDSGMTAVAIAVGTASYHRQLPPSLPHAWDGSTLIVREADAEVVGAWVAATEGTLELALDPAADKLAYDVEDLSDEHLTTLLRTLLTEGIRHELSADGELFVHEEDEAAVEAILDRIDFPDELPAQADDELEDPDDGLVAQEVLSDLFEASDRLANDPRNADAVLGVVEGSERLGALPVPFGFDRTEWQALLAQADGVKALVEAARPDQDAVEEAARALRDVLHRLV